MDVNRATNDITDHVRGLNVTTGTGVDAIMPVVYSEIRRLAQAYMNLERANHTLSATALANEAYLRLVDQARVSFENRDHFVAVAATVIRRILVDHARSKGRLKRGGEAAQISLNTSILINSGQNVDLLALEESLNRLAEREPEKARVVEMRFFGEMTEEQIARVLGVTERTVRRYWQYARAWLYRELTDEDQPCA